MPLARASVLGKLFGEHSVVGTFGRFRVLSRLGAGGMGVVYEAYDPELARGVALKLVGVTASGSRAALAEAKTLAQLSHPNVVPVFDVGVEHDHIYLVMELVRGKTLRDWSKQRTSAQILAVYHQAGAALAAAHRAGIVHRDFKPENAIVGIDGRVRVVDFGLACESDTAGEPSRPRAIAGTPRFMAPEAKAGIATPAADQYSFCLALGDSLAQGREPAARRIARILERGSAQTPAARYPSMEELLTALARDPARTRRRVLAGVATATCIALAAYTWGRQPRNAARPCDDGADQLAAAWSPAARAAALDRLATLGPDGSSLRRLLVGALDTYDRGWKHGYRDACVDGRSGTESGALIDRRTQCLRRGSDALAAVGELIAHAEASTLVELPRAVQSMPDPAACSDRKALISDIPLPPPELAEPLAQIRRRVEDARIRIAAGRYDEALRDSVATVSRARELRYGPALAEALLVQGHARTKLAHHDEAVPTLAEAAKVAIASHADALAIEAWARRVYAQGTTTNEYASIRNADLEMIEALAQRTEGAAFARALLYNNLGSLALANDRRADARADFERALTEAQRLGQPGPLELVGIRANLGVATDDHARGDELLARAISELSERLGADHPDTLTLRQMQVLGTSENLGRAAELLEPVCRAEQADPSLAGTVDCWTEVGLLRADLGDRARAIDALLAATRARGDAREAQAHVSLLRGDVHGAVRQFAAAVAADVPGPNEHWWDRLRRARLALGLGQARRAGGDLVGARAALDDAVALLEPIAREHPAATYERRLGRARVELAFTLSALGAPSAARASAVSAALAWLDKVGGSRDEIEQLRR